MRFITNVVIVGLVSCAVSGDAIAESTTMNSDASEIDREVQRIQSLRNSKRSEEWEGVFSAVRDRWMDREDSSYALLTYEACRLISSYDFPAEIESLGPKYSKAALEDAKVIPVDIQLRLALALQLPRKNTGTGEWVRLRKEYANHWFASLARLHSEILPDFDFEDMPLMHVSPPSGAKVSAGASPESIRDPKLRAEYEASIKANDEKGAKYDKQFLLQRLKTSLGPLIEKRIVIAYSTDPANLEEFNELSKKHRIDEGLAQRLKLEISERSAAMKAADSTTNAASTREVE